MPGAWLCRCRPTQLLSPFSPCSLSFAMTFKKEVRFSDHGGTYDPDIQEERSGTRPPCVGAGHATAHVVNR